MENLRKIANVRFQNPYVIYFRINDQESFSLRNLSLSNFLPLRYDDDYTAEYIRSLIASGAVENSDDDIKVISRSIDNSKFVLLNSSSLDFTLDKVAEGTEFLESVETLKNSQDYNNDVDLVIHNSHLQSMKEVLGVSKVINTPLPTSSSFTKQSLETINPKILPSLKEAPLLLVSIPSSNTLSSPVSVVLAKTPSSVSVSLPNISSSVSATRASSTPSSSGSASVAGISSSISLSVPASTSKVHPELPKPDTHRDGMLQNRHSKPKSQVWDSFTKVNFISARCKICTNVLKHGGNTTNLRQHLDRKHPLPPGVSTGKEQKGILNFKRTSNKKWRAENEDEPAPIEVKMRRSNENSTDEKIDTAFQRVHSFTAGGTTADKITNGILFMLAADNCPLSVVENEGFLNLMKITAPLYNVPSRRTITRLMEDKYTLLRDLFKREINQANSITLTCDIWSDISNRGYLGITVHYLLGKSMNKGCLGVFPLEENHTAHYISEMLIESIRLFHIDTNIVTAIVTDNGANVKKAIIDSFGISKHIQCFAHVLSHIVPNSIRATAGIEETIMKVKQIVTLTKRSVIAADELRRLQIRDGKTEATVLKFKQDVLTRWNSTLIMIERFLELHEYVYPVTLKCSVSVDLLTREELDVLRDLK